MVSLAAALTAATIAEHRSAQPWPECAAFFGGGTVSAGFLALIEGIALL